MPQEQGVSASFTYRRLFDGLVLPNEKVKMFQIIVAIGCMISSAVASPILFELQTTRIWFIDILIFFVSAACFMLQNQEEIKQHGPYALAAYTCFGLGAYSSTRTTLSELVPWIPISLCISLLLTVFFPPKIRELCAAPENDEILMEEGRFLGFHRSPVQPGSVQSDGHIQHREQSPMTTRWVRNSEHDVAYTLGRPASRYSSRSLHDSTIVLDDFEDEPYRGECMVRPQEAENYTSTPPQDMPEASLPCQHAAGAEAESYPRSTSSDSLFEGPEISEEIPLL